MDTKRTRGAPPETPVSQAGFTNHLLLALPSVTDADFAHSVTLICEHSDRGALGLMLNKPLPMSLAEVFSQMKLTAHDPQIGGQPVLCGGPLRTDRGFVLHRPGGEWDSTHKVSELIQVTTSRDVLAAMASGSGPTDAYVALGFARWDPGQLEREIRENAWLPVPATEQILFQLPFAERWQVCWRLLGVDVERLSLSTGNA
jgi:putative transcriptional regulator